MVHLPSLIAVFSVASNIAAYSTYARNAEAKIELFLVSSVSKSPSPLTDLECGSQMLSTHYTLPVDNCLWGDYYLVNNLKIKRHPTCRNGQPAVALFYSTTSCTGKTTFRSDKANVKLEERCLFGSSPEKWSMIFRCENLESQSVARRSFRQADPPRLMSSLPRPGEKKVDNAKRTASDGVVTPFSSSDCSIMHPKEPTFLPADTCLKLENSNNRGSSLYISQPVVCANGTTARVHTYEDNRCSTKGIELRTSKFSTATDFEKLDKTCHRTKARSIAFHCGAKELTKFEDLPPYEFKDVEPLVLLPPPSVPTPIPSPKLSFGNPQSNSGQNRQNNWVSVEWDGSKWASPPPKYITLPTEPQGGTFMPYRSLACGQSDSRSQAPSTKAVDKCILTRGNQYKSMKIISRPVCANGTLALLATYKSTGCRNMERLGDIPSEWIRMADCPDTNSIASMAFWCDGLPTDQIQQESEGFIVFKMLAIIFGIVMLMVALIVLSIFLKGRRMIQDGSQIWDAIIRPFGRREGEIQL